MSIRESNGERFNSIPEIAIISDEDLEHFYNIYKPEIHNTLRLSANFDVLENNQTFYNDLNSIVKHYEDELRKKLKSPNEKEIVGQIYKRQEYYSIGTSFSNILGKLHSTNKINELNGYLQKNEFDYTVIVEMRPTRNHLNVYQIVLFNKQQSKELFENLRFRYKLKFIILLWIFTLKITWTEVNKCVVILDDFDCFFNEENLNSLAQVVLAFTKLEEFKQIGVKFILTTHCNNYSKIAKSTNFYKIENNTIVKHNNMFFTKCDFSFSDKKNHSYIHKFDCVHFEENFNHLKSLKPWKGIPMFSIITGVNGIGKTTLLKYFNSIYSKSFFISGLGEMNIDFDKYLDLLNEELTKKNLGNTSLNSFHPLNQINNQNERGILKKIIQENPLPIILKYSANYHLPILIELIEIETINMFLKLKNFKWRISIQDKTELVDISDPNLSEKLISGYKVGNFIIRSINQIKFKHEKSNVGYYDLSPGERLLLSMYLWEFDLNKDDSLRGSVKPSAKNRLDRYVLLLDEPDVHLHPSKFKHEIVDFLKQTLVENLKFQVIMTTHNPCTIALAQSKDVFCMYSTNDYIEIREASASLVPPIEQLSSGITIITQQLVLVESDEDRIYFGEICRQLNELASSGNSQFRLFYGEQGQQVRFVCPQFKENDEHKKVEKREKLLDISKNLEKLLTDKFNEYKNSFISSTREITEKEAEEKLRNQFKRSIPEEKVKKYVENLNRLEKLPNKFFEDIEPNLDPSMIDIVTKMKTFFEESYEELNPTSPRKTIESLVKQVNYFYNFQSMSRNYTFGLLNGKNASTDSENIFIINTDRNSLENYIFDPINLFFILRRENIKSKKSNAITRFVNEEIGKDKKLENNLRKENIDLDNWNQYFNQVKETTNLKVLGSLLNLILKVMQNFILKEDVIEIEDMSSENQDIEFLQPYNIKLQYNSHILNSNLPMETIKSFFGENDFVLSRDNVLNYLIESSYNFLISKEFVNGFRKKFEKLNDLSKKS